MNLHRFQFSSGPLLGKQLCCSLRIFTSLLSHQALLMTCQPPSDLSLNMTVNNTKAPLQIPLSLSHKAPQMRREGPLINSHSVHMNFNAVYDLISRWRMFSSPSWNSKKEDSLFVLSDVASWLIRLKVNKSLTWLKYLKGNIHILFWKLFYWSSGPTHKT